MHPEIKKFWEDSGYSIVVDVAEGLPSINDLWRFYWAVINKNNELDWKYVGWSDPVLPGTKNAPCTIYSIEGSIGSPPDKTFSEKEMLRIVRLKAFI